MGLNASSTVNTKEEPVPRPTTNRLSDEYYIRRLAKRHGHIDFDVESWYPILESETFTTRFIPMSPSIARAFVNYYQTRYNSKNLLTSADLEHIRCIESELEQNISGGAFVRLSSRSPKDGNPLDGERFDRVYQDELRRLQEDHPAEMESSEGRANLQFIAFSAAQSQCLKVTTAPEALSLILSSERAFFDLLEALDCQEAKEIIDHSVQHHQWNEHIIIRQWNDRLDHAMEFRCFVYQSELTAISQYNHYCKFNHLQDAVLVEQVKSIIIGYWQTTLRDRLCEKYSNYVIDLGLIREDGFRCVVIEMNPFESTTGASLFDWNTDHEQLTGQTDEIEIRVRLDYFPHVEDYVEMVLRENHAADELPPYRAFLRQFHDRQKET